MTHDLLAERDRTHELQIDLASLELQIKHAVQVTYIKSLRDFGCSV